MLAVPILVAKIAECHEVVPDQQSRWIILEWYDVVDLGAWSDPAVLLTVLTQWVLVPVPP